MNRGVQPFGVGAVYAQLVGPACVGVELHAGLAVKTLNHFLARDGLLAVILVHKLAGWVVWVGAHTQLDFSLVASDFSVN